MSAYVSTGWLEEHLSDSNVRVIEASISKDVYDAAHIPGAVWVDHLADLLRNGDETSGDVLTPGQYADLMSRLGVDDDMTIVWYGDRHSSYAIRGFWTNDVYQHAGAVHVLEGGRERWIEEGRPVTSDLAQPARADYAVPTQRNESNRATWKQVNDAIGAPNCVVLDVRSQAEYDGTNPRARRGGHIPGAVHIEWTDATDGDNVLRNADELQALYGDAGVTPDKAILAHCQLGIRAAHTWFVLKHVLGYPDVKNYDGSWQEWGNRDDSPIET